MSVVSHAVTNILKRVLVVLLLYVTGSRSASPINFLGLGVCTLGLVAYAWSKRYNTARTASSQDYHPHKQRIDLCTLSKYIILVTCSLFCGLFLGVVRDFTIPTTADSVFPAVVLDSAGYGQQFTQWSMARLATEKINDTQFERTFTHRAQELPNKEDLLPDLGGYLSQYKNDIEGFLQEDLVANPHRSSFLSRKLRTHVEVIKEAQRLHFDIIGTVLKKYKYAILFDLATMENKGDPCISVGEMHFLARIKLKLLYYCTGARCTKKRFRMAEEQARRYSTDDLAILVHGGGNIVGYKTSDEHRFTIFEYFKGFKIFVFPQSVFIRSLKSPHFDICKKKYCCNENVTFVMRDHQSYRYAQQYFSGTTKYILAPDMAFQIGPMPRFLSPVFDIMWIRRTDAETPGYKAIPSAPPGIRMHVSDWWKWKTPGAPNSIERANYVCTNGFFYLQRGRVVITDRLHGHILATLMNIPHVLIDNKQHKLSAYHLSWTAGLENTYITDNPNTALDLALKLLEKYKDVLPPRLPFLQIDEQTSKILEFGKPEDGYA
ncbi:hypothetical protein EGW08_020255 [Elysia chlorotica]|uniref:Polysaccharide pyruvyl transferase domain-containing protein n=1 Tax=Elysia chlorotica TaxID=188477 RepID=A0A433SRW6_ELYCH|nr:hypothetical protein EGW08_020255 [Elysia chlorotica]